MLYKSKGSLQVKIIILLLAAQFTGCTTIRYKYTADVEIKRTEQKEFAFEKNYPSTLYAALCGLSFWAYGGWCWMYLGRPTSDDIDMVSRDAEFKIRQLMKRKKLGKYDFEVLGSRVSREDWGWVPKETEVVFSSKYISE
jgi:hypothetical protein